uniref:C2H2-type domain-containing protein n=1 Tax=Denticeps clupeoides TaxID=299321 RepID=A0AAY4A0H3_9TELE
MSHPLYNSRGAAFSGGQRTGQFGLSTQPNLALSGSRVDPGSLSSQGPSGDWPRYPSSSKPFSSQGMGLSTSSSTLFPTSGYGSPPRSGRSSERLPPLSASAERRPLRYTSESASSILANFGLTSEDLELLSLYPDEELTPDNLPFILRDIRMRKGKRIPERDDRLAPDPQHGKVIDYGHSSKFGYSEERSESFSRDHLPKDTLKYAREVAASGSPFGISTGPIAKKPTPMDIRSSAGLANIHVPKVSSPLLPLPILPAVALPVLGFGPRPALMKMGAVGAALQPAIRPSGFHASNPAGVKRLPTPTMMNDYSAATPRIFPHTCSLCNVECAQIKDWIEHQNTNLHIERCRLLRKQNVETSASLSVERRSPKRRSKSWSRSPSPSRNHASTARRKRSRSRSPRRFRRSRSHSHSRSPRRKSRSSPALHRRRSRSPPSTRAPPQRRSPQRRSPLVSPLASLSPSPHRSPPPPPPRAAPPRGVPPRRSPLTSHGRHSPPHFNAHRPALASLVLIGLPVAVSYLLRS